MRKIIFVLVLLGVSGALMAEAEYDKSYKASQAEFVREFNDLFSFRIQYPVCRGKITV